MHFLHGLTAHSGLRSAHCWGFGITLRHTTLCFEITLRNCKLCFKVIIRHTIYCFEIKLRHTTVCFEITPTHISLCRTPLEEGSARRRDIYLIPKNTHNRQTDMSPTGIEPGILACKRPQTHASDSTATGFAIVDTHNRQKNSTISAENSNLIMRVTSNIRTYRYVNLLYYKYLSLLHVSATFLAIFREMFFEECITQNLN